MAEIFIGEKRKNTKGTDMQIVRMVDSEHIDVQFLDSDRFVKENVLYINFKSGAVKNPYDRIILGVGYIGHGQYKSKINGDYQTEYNTWKDIIRRCYYNRDADKFFSYYGVCTMCDEWLNYQNFAAWFNENKIDVNGRLHIDKDILCPGNHLYSPETCILIPQRINMIFTNKQNSRGLPNGIRKHKEKYFVKYNLKELGFAYSVEEAFLLYAEAKEDRIKEAADEYREVLSLKAYNALINYKVDIKNDKNYMQLQ